MRPDRTFRSVVLPAPDGYGAELVNTVHSSIQHGTTYFHQRNHFSWVCLTRDLIQDDLFLVARSDRVLDIRPNQSNWYLLFPEGRERALEIGLH